MDDDDDDSLQQEAAITLAKKHHEMLMTRKKADRKMKDDEEFNDWTCRVTINSIVLSSNSESIESIDSKPVDMWNMKYLRALCSRVGISGYKNAKREQMVNLLFMMRKKNKELLDERIQYGKEVRDSNDDDDEVDSQMPAETEASSPVTRSITASSRAAAAALQVQANQATARKRCARKVLPVDESPAVARKKQKKVNKSAVPSAITLDGTYYRAINIWFDERNRNHIINMGSAPSIQELDARKKFKNKSTYDKLLLTYLDDSTENNSVSYIGFNNEYLNDCGIADRHAGDFDILTSEDLCEALDYIVHWYNVAYRNNQTSGTANSCSLFFQCLLSHITMQSSLI